MSSNFFASLDAEAPQLPTDIPVESTKHSKYSSKMMRKMALTNEVSFETTTIDTGSGLWETTGAKNGTNNKEYETNSKSATTEEPKSAPAEPAKRPKMEDAALDYEAQKKTKKAAKKLRQKIKKGKVLQDKSSQGDSEAMKGTAATEAEASGSTATPTTAPTNITAGLTVPAVASEVGLVNPDQVQPSSAEIEHIAVVDFAVIHETDAKGHAPTKATATTTIRLAPPGSIVVPRKNTSANKRKKENAKKAQEAKKKAELRTASKQKWMKGLGSIFFLCMALWVMYMSFSRG
ncbi:uncharacterized protein N0V89_006937 [Didymosphaeria variabile]|uniref:Uncharacterized protein n=1 Tax=Didymosphaeria variabile TaxID=1932322 RepID=A0A9W9C909_9PLEO|nr:uncharacterized protein N0V89_006937 [Didymosphaeria variabile]KAJ4351594.1 hypothetical protein N0V89_006937 [Didymosphaeria variabile]